MVAGYAYDPATNSNVLTLWNLRTGAITRQRPGHALARLLNKAPWSRPSQAAPRGSLASMVAPPGGPTALRSRRPALALAGQ